MKDADPVTCRLLTIGEGSRQTQRRGHPSSRTTANGPPAPLFDKGFASTGREGSKTTAAEKKSQSSLEKEKQKLRLPPSNHRLKKRTNTTHPSRVRPSGGQLAGVIYTVVRPHEKKDESNAEGTNVLFSGKRETTTT